MSIRRRAIGIISKSNILKKAIEDKRYRVILTASESLFLNIAYALYHGALGIIYHSWWSIALFGYYVILGMTRFSAVLCERKNGNAPSLETELFVMRIVGILFILLSCAMAGINYISLEQSNAARYGEITMITIATYTFYKITMAVIRIIKQRHDPSPLLSSIRRIGYAEAAVSLLTMQRSMLVSFGDMALNDTTLMNALTGAGVYLFILIMGIITIQESRGKKMDKSKFVKANEKIAEKVVEAYNKVEETVVGGYNKVEETVVGGYTKIEDAFVDKYLKKDGETIEDAKQRLKKEQE